MKDDGVGLPQSFDPASSRSFGWRLIRTLTDQLGGALALHPGEGGTRVTIYLPSGEATA